MSLPFKTAKSGISAWLLALLAMLVVLATEQLIEHFAQREAIAREKNAVSESLSTLRARFEGVVNANLLLVQGLSAVISAQPSIDQAGFARIARGLVDERHALRNIAGAPDMVISLMYPIIGNEAAIGLDYRTHPTQREAALRVMQTGQPVVAGPLTLQQGGIGIIAREPVFALPEQPGEKPRFWGLISAVIDIDQLYRQAGLEEAGRTLRIAIRGSNGTGADGPVFYGDATIFERDPVLRMISLPGGAWQMAAAPLQGWGASNHTLWLIRLLAVLVALMAGVLVYLWARGSQALAASEAGLRSLLNTIPDLVWLKDRNGVYLACNPRFEHLYGFKERDIIGKTDADFVPAEIAETYRAHDLATLAADTPRITEEWRTYADGRRELAETIKAPVRDAAAKLIGVLGIARDITERKQNEQRIQGLNRIYAVLSGINQAILRMREPQALFEEVCRIAVELGGFRMAWLGMADPQTGQVQPLAYAGEVGAYLEKVTLSFAQNELDQTDTPQQATATALKQGRHVLSNDIANDPEQAPWRELTTALGYRASARFPIQVAGEVRGVFSLYAERTGFFDAAELRLLDELAQNIGFALELIESNNARDALNRRMLDLLESMSDGFVSLDRNGCYQYLNRRAGEMLGRNVAELVGHSLWTEFPEGADEAFQTACRKVMEDGRVSRLEAYFSPRNLWFENRIYPTHEGISIFFTDITERRQAEVAERQQRDILDRTSRLAMVGGWTFDAASMTGTWTDEAARIHDLEPAASTSVEQGLSFFHGESRQILQNAIQAAIEQAQPYDLELEMTSAKGNKKWVRTIGLPVLADGRVERLEGAIQDIDKRKLAEVRAKQGEALLDSVFQALPDMFFLLDNSGVIQDYRARIDAALYVPPEVFLGKRMQDVLPEEVARLCQVNLDKVRQFGGLATYEYALELPAGREYFEARLSRIPDSEQFIVVVRDITQRKRMETEIRQINAALEDRVRQRTAELDAANQELETFAYSVSHDLKAPLRGIDGYSRLLQEDHQTQLDQEGRMFLANVRHGVEQMNQLIEDLLAYSRMERRNLAGIELNLSDQITAVLNEREQDIADKHVQIKLALDTALRLRADPDGLAMVLRNLIDNALKFSRQSQPPRMDISASQTDESIILAIKDNGIGFDMKFQERIFEIFQRLQRAEDYPGTGVGLAIVRKAMQRMGGQVWAESAPGQGATFYLALPR